MEWFSIENAIQLNVFTVHSKTKIRTAKVMNSPYRSEQMITFSAINLVLSKYELISLKTESEGQIVFSTLMSLTF